MLQNKNILIGVTGSIAIYKTLELVRLFIKQRASVRVIMSEEAKRFITPITFEALSQNSVLHNETESWANDNNHIHIGKWADIFIVAPISANTIGKLSFGIADNLLTQSILAYTKTIILAPSANTNMILNPITQENITKLKNRGFIICEPQSKLLACLDEGTGAMSDVQEIYYTCARELLKEDFWMGKDVIITGGGSVELIDDVRCLGNLSSGKMADALTLALYLLGANVTLISSSTSLQNLHVTISHVRSSSEFETALHQALTKGALLFMAAAISDYVPSFTQKGKLKKESLGEHWSLELKKNRDILLELNKEGIKTIGFKAETDKEKAQQNAQDMLKSKSLDAVCLNILGEKNNFGSDKNEISFITKDSTIHLELSSKFDIAMQIASLAKAL